MACGKKWTPEECRERKREENRKYRAAHREQARKYLQEYRKSHREQERKRNRKYRQEYRAAHREQDRERQRKYRRRYRVIHADQEREWKRGRQQRRRAHFRALNATFTTADWRFAMAYWHGACAYCGQPPRLWDSPRVLHQDHFISLSAGGHYTPDNIVPACPACNLSKGNSDPAAWLGRVQSATKCRKTLRAIQVFFAVVKERSMDD